MTILQRLKAAATVFRHGYPNRPVVLKSAPYVWPAGMQNGGYSMNTYADLITVGEYGFNVNSVIYAAIMYKVRAVAKAPLRAYTGERFAPELLPDNHWLQQLCRRPNPKQSYMQFSGLNTVYLNLTGNAYILLDKPSPKKPPVAMYPLRPDRVEIIPSKDNPNDLVGYTYAPGGQRKDKIPILPEYMIHVKLPNPLDPLEGFGEGFSPVWPMALSGDVDNAVTRFLKRLFDSGVLNYGVIETDQLLQPDTIARLREEWVQMYGGVDEWGKPLVTDQGLKYRPLIPDFTALGMEAVDSRSESRMLAPFGVPAALIGLRLGLENATYSNIEELRRIFWEDTMTWEINLFGVDYSYHLAEQYESGVWLAHDLSDVPALQRNIPELAQAAHTLWSMGIPINAAIATVGIDLEPVEGGDISYIPTSVVDANAPPPEPPKIVIAPPNTNPPDNNPPPVGENPTPPAENPPAQPNGQDGGGKTQIGQPALVVSTSRKTYGQRFDGKGDWDEDNSLKMWLSQDTVAIRHEADYRTAARKAMETDLAEISGIIRREKKKALRSKATVTWEHAEQSALDYLKTDSRDNWRDLFIPRSKALVADAANTWAGEIGMAFNVDNLYAGAWFDDYVMTFAEQTSDTTQGGIKDLLQQARAEGWTVDTGMARLELLFRQWMEGNVSPEDFAWISQRLPQFRLEAIVRTETIRMYGGGTDALFQEWGVKQKVWWAHQDERLCPFCGQLHGKVLTVGKTWYEDGDSVVADNAADPEKPFRMTLSYGDVKHPPLHVFCRCLELPVI